MRYVVLTQGDSCFWFVLLTGLKAKDHFNGRFIHKDPKLVWLARMAPNRQRKCSGDLLFC